MNTVKSTIKILYRDDHYIVFDKPSGLLVIPTPKNEQRTLVSVVNQQYASETGSFKLHPCHRIDRDTSGVILFAKGKQCQKKMMGLFKERAVVKKYIAFIHGKLDSNTGEFKRTVRRVRQTRSKRNISGIPAVTQYKVLKTKKSFSVVEVRPITGRTNQIRIHFSQAGHPLVGERKYAFAKDYAVKFRRAALHAASLEWIHPISHKKVYVESKLPEDMAQFLTTN